MTVKEVIKELLKLGFKEYPSSTFFGYSKLYQYVIDNRTSLNIYYYEIEFPEYNQGLKDDLELEICKERRVKWIKEKRYSYNDYKDLLDDVKVLIRG